MSVVVLKNTAGSAVRVEIEYLDTETGALATKEATLEPNWKGRDSVEVQSCGPITVNIVDVL